MAGSRKKAIPVNWDTVVNVFDPFAPVPVERIGDWFAERPGSPRPLLIKSLSPARTPMRYILVGQPASGKSSELMKLAVELQEKHNSLAVLINLDAVMDIEQATPVEVLFLMGMAAFKIASQELKDNPPDRALLEELKTGLETVVREHTQNTKFSFDLGSVLEGLVVLGGGSLGAVVGGPLGAAAGIGVVKSVASGVGKVFRFFTSGLDSKIVRKVEVEPKVEAMVVTLNRLLDDIRTRLRDRSLVLLIDGLDKLRHEEVIRVNFVENKFLLGPKCSILYVGPLDLYYSPDLGSVRTTFEVIPFSHVKLHPRDDSKTLHTEGYKALRDVAHRRLRSLELNPNDIIPKDTLDLLIKGSAGVMRDFIRLVRQAADQAALTEASGIDHSHAVRALNGLRRQLTAQLTPEYHKILDQVRETQERVDGDQGEKCDQLLRNDVVLSYFNDDVWFAPHSILTDRPWV
jgi:hypothetical protein